MRRLRQINLKNLLIHLGLYILAVVLLFVLLNWFLKWYTHHGESVSVPDLVGTSIEEVEAKLDEKELRFEIKDSVYAPGKPFLSVVEQNPKAGSKVKRGRRIYLILNTDKAPMVAIPEFKEQPSKQVQRSFQSVGITIEGTRMVPNLALNAVIDVYYKGQTVEAGTKIPKGSKVILALGDGDLPHDQMAPSLIGKTYDEAALIIKGNDYNIGAVDYDKNTVHTKEDSANAIIYKQNPLPDSKISTGSAIDILLKKGD